MKCKTSNCPNEAMERNRYCKPCLQEFSKRYIESIQRLQPVSQYQPQPAVNRRNGRDNREAK